MVLRDGRGHTIPQMVIILCLLLMTTSDNHVFCQVPRTNFRMKLSSIATVIGLGCPGLFTVAAVERRGGGEEEWKDYRCCSGGEGGREGEERKEEESR